MGQEDAHFPGVPDFEGLPNPWIPVAIGRFDSREQQGFEGGWIRLIKRFLQWAGSLVGATGIGIAARMRLRHVAGRQYASGEKKRGAYPPG